MLFIGAFLKKRGRLQLLRVITISVQSTFPNIPIEGPFGALFSRRFLGVSLKRRACFLDQSGASLKKHGRLQTFRVIRRSKSLQVLQVSHMNLYCELHLNGVFSPQLP